MVSRHHIRLIQVSNFLDLNIYAKTPWGPRVLVSNENREMVGVWIMRSDPVGNTVVNTGNINMTNDRWNQNGKTRCRD